MSLRRYNLNNMAVLQSLLRHRNVTRAGEELGLSQSAMSHALKRLREQFSDPLLVSVGRDMLLTHKAQALKKPLDEALGTLESLLDTEVFDPSTSSRAFSIATLDHVGAMILPPLLAHLSMIAPEVLVKVEWIDRDVGSRLRSGELDIALLRNHMESPDLHHEPMFTDELVVIMSADNAVARRRLSLEQFLSLPFATYGRGFRDRPSLAELQLRERGLQPRERVIVPDFTSLCHVVEQSSYISLVPRKFAELTTKRMAIKLVQPPFVTDLLTVSGCWAHHFDRDPGHRWFRQSIADYCRHIE